MLPGPIVSSSLLLASSLPNLTSAKVDRNLDQKRAVPEAHLLTYWIHETCGNKIDASLREALEMAAIAAARLQDGDDTLAARYYELIFKAPRQLIGNPNDPVMSEELDISSK
jgi:hypothetical protein